MNELIERVQEQLDNNWAVEAKDIQRLIDSSLSTSDIGHLLWVRNRLVHVYKESENTDFIIRFDSILDSLLNKSHPQSDSE